MTYDSRLGLDTCSVTRSTGSDAPTPDLPPAPPDRHGSGRVQNEGNTEREGKSQEWKEKNKEHI